MVHSWRKEALEGGGGGGVAWQIQETVMSPVTIFATLMSIIKESIVACLIKKSPMSCY